MSTLDQLAAWLHAGGPVLPVITLVALVLYALVAARVGDLWSLDPAQLPGDPAARRNRLARGLASIRVLAGVLPLLGLLGTVHGIIAVFATAVAGPGRAAAGIGEALITTQYGLATAIPALIADWALRRRAQALERSDLRPALRPSIRTASAPSGPETPR